MQDNEYLDEEFIDDDSEFEEEYIDDDSDELEGVSADETDFSDAENYFGAPSDDNSDAEEQTEDTEDTEEPEEPELDANLMAQYDKNFTGEEQIDQMLSGITGKFKTHIEAIPVDSIILPKIKKEMREQTIIGLTGLVRTLTDVVTPIHVMTLEDDDESYVLLDGTRRLYSAIKCGNETINAVIWDFDDKNLGKSISNILGLVLNRSQKLKNKELWQMLRVLETVNKCTPGRIEFLLQMEAGDAMRLKDVMLAEGDEEVAEVKEKFLSGELTIDAAYKKIAKIRKTENRLERDEERELDLRTADEVDEGKAAPAPASTHHLSNDEVMKILEMGDEDVSDQTLEALREKGEKMREEANAPHVQKVGERHPVDPAIRQATFERDGYKCRCCGIGDELYLSILVFHHAVPVFADGPDTVENGLTLCANCHLMLHNYVDGHLHGDISEYTPEEQKTLRNIFKYGNIALRAAQAKGLKKGDIHELDASSRQHIMPNTFVKANDTAFYATQGSGKSKAKSDDEDVAEPEDADDVLVGDFSEEDDDE